MDLGGRSVVKAETDSELLIHVDPAIRSSCHGPPCVVRYFSNETRRLSQS